MFIQSFLVCVQCNTVQSLALQCCGRKVDPSRTAKEGSSCNSPGAREVSPYCRHDVHNMFILLRYLCARRYIFGKEKIDQVVPASCTYKGRHVREIVEEWKTILMSLAIFYFAYYAFNMFRTLIYPSSGACDCVDELPHRSSFSQFVVCWSFCCGWYLVVSFCRLKH